MRQPSPGAPRRFSAGTATSEKKTSLKSAAWGSVSSGRGRHVIPADLMSTIRALIPRCLGTSVSVLTKHRHQSAWWAPEVHTFCPLTTKWSPSSTALVLSPARSLPAPGSLIPRHQVSSARSVGSAHLSFWSSVPNSTIEGVTMDSPWGFSDRGISPAAISSK